MSAHSPEMVRWMLATLGLPPELVGRPNAIRFGPFVFAARPATLTAGSSIVINDAAGTIDEKLITLDGDRKYWLLLSGYRQFWSYKTDEDEAEQAKLFQQPFLKMNRNDQNTFDQLAWASNQQTSGQATTVAGATLRSTTPLPAYMFKWWWVLDGESDPLTINSRLDTTGAFLSTVNSYTWMYGFAIRKSVMETFPEPECGPGALAKLAQQGPTSLSSVAAILGLS